jgi:hypothetical protein
MQARRAGTAEEHFDWTVRLAHVPRLRNRRTDHGSFRRRGTPGCFRQLTRAAMSQNAKRVYHASANLEQ